MAVTAVATPRTTGIVLASAHTVRVAKSDRAVTLGFTDPICQDFILRSTVLFWAPRQLLKKTAQSVHWSIFASSAFLSVFLSKRVHHRAAVFVWSRRWAA